MHSDDGQWWFDGHAWHSAFSHDGRSWFGGNAWLPVLSPDRRYRFDGVRWLRRHRSSALLLLVGTAFLVLVMPCSLVVYMQAASVPEYPGQPQPAWLWQLELATKGLTYLGVALLVLGFAVRLYEAYPTFGHRRVPPPER